MLARYEINESIRKLVKRRPTTYGWFLSSFFSSQVQFAFVFTNFLTTAKVEYTESVSYSIITKEDQICNKLVLRALLCLHALGGCSYYLDKPITRIELPYNRYIRIFFQKRESQAKYGCILPHNFLVVKKLGIGKQWQRMKMSIQHD